MPYFRYKNKQCYYEESETGNPLLFLHGNTVSSKMFTNVVHLYKEKHKIVLIDFLGHGRSQKIDRFSIDLWFDEAMQVVQFLDQIKYKKSKYYWQQRRSFGSIKCST